MGDQLEDPHRTEGPYPSGAHLPEGADDVKEVRLCLFLDRLVGEGEVDEVDYTGCQGRMDYRQRGDPLVMGNERSISFFLLFIFATSGGELGSGVFPCLLTKE